ncbi:MAG: MFS transporter [Pirellulales bacterium]
MSDAVPNIEQTPLSRRARYLVLAVAFLGWMFAGTQMSITPLMSRSATIDLLWPDQQGQALSQEQRELVGLWFSWHNASFLFGAAAGGLLFGWLGDRAGRTRAMAWSILCYSCFSGLSYLVVDPYQLLVLRFLTCLGVGGMWPNGVALVSEAWSEVSRPTLAGIIGTSANVGIVMMGIASIYFRITPESWRWMMLVGATPVVLGIFVWAAVPESPRWAAGRLRTGQVRPPAPVAEIFRPPLLHLTLIGICLGTVPLLGGWGSGNWLVPWADEVGGTADPYLKGWTQVMRSLGGTLGSLAGGWVAGALGRRRSYFLISLASLAISAYIFRGLHPATAGEYSFGDFAEGLIGVGPAIGIASVNLFSLWAFMLGVFSGLYFGWLPLCLPELFPTRVRSTGAGVAFNSGRVGAAIGVLGAGELIKSHYGGDYGRVGAITSLIYAVGMIVIWLAPKTDEKLKD